MLTEALDYTLPPQLIATEPLEPRDAARLLVIDRHSGRIAHHQVRDLPDLIANPPHSFATPQPGDLFVFNQSRVIAASFTARRSATNGQVGGLYLTSPSTQNSDHWLVMLESRGRLREGEQLDLDQDTQLELLESRRDGQWLAKLTGPHDTSTLLNRIGHPPLPPYIRRQRRQRGQAQREPRDRDRYNTVFATTPGSIAAPTAGLHFTKTLLAKLEQLGVRSAVVTLHVGLGTFAPVRTARLEDHTIHGEWITVPVSTLSALDATRRDGGRIIPIGTTTVRALESLPDPLPNTGDFTAFTDLFITPADKTNTSTAATTTAGGSSFPFRFTDALLTNFHLPRSTLLAMVAALPDVGLDRLKGWYQTAIDKGYRFYSYGDAMLIL